MTRLNYHILAAYEHHVYHQNRRCNFLILYMSGPFPRREVEKSPFPYFFDDFIDCLPLHFRLFYRIITGFEAYSSVYESK